MIFFTYLKPFDLVIFSNIEGRRLINGLNRDYIHEINSNPSNY